MLTDYIAAAMRNAKFETLCDGTVGIHKIEWY